MPKWYDIRRYFRRKSDPRRFKAGVSNRLTADWITETIKTNDDIKAYLNVLVQRSRNLAKNSSAYRKFLWMAERNVIGHEGIKLQVKARNSDGSPDAIGNNMIESNFREWGRKRNQYCTLDGKLSWIDAQKLFVRTLMIDGECFVRKIRSSRNPYGFSMQFLDSQDCDINQNTDKYTARNRIVMGIELDDDDRPVAYYFKNQDVMGPEYSRFSADDIIHAFVTEFPGQVRGFPRGSSAILDINMSDGYKEAELVAARSGAGHMGFWKRTGPGGGAGRLSDGEENETPVSEIAPGTFPVVPRNFEFVKYDPAHPAGNYDPFIKSIYRDAANGMDLSYNEFANDLVGVSFSSLRGGTLSERDGWKIAQTFVIEHFHEVVYPEWLSMFLISGMTNIPFTKREKFMADTWQARRWPWVDPLKDAKANIEMVGSYMKSPIDVISEQGGDPEALFDDIIKFKEKLESIGLAFNTGEKETAIETTAGKNMEDDENE